MSCQHLLSRHAMAFSARFQSLFFCRLYSSRLWYCFSELSRSSRFRCQLSQASHRRLTRCKVYSVWKHLAYQWDPWLNSLNFWLLSCSFWHWGRSNRSLAPTVPLCRQLGLWLASFVPHGIHAPPLLPRCWLSLGRCLCSPLFKDGQPPEREHSHAPVGLVPMVLSLILLSS